MLLAAAERYARRRREFTINIDDYASMGAMMVTHAAAFASVYIDFDEDATDVGRDIMLSAFSRDDGAPFTFIFTRAAMDLLFSCFPSLALCLFIGLISP